MVDNKMPCHLAKTPVAAEQLRDGNTRAEGSMGKCAYKSRHTSPRPYAYLDDLSSVRCHVTWSVAMASQAWRAPSGGQTTKKPFGKTVTLLLSLVPLAPCASPPPSIRLFICFLIPRTSRQATVICMMWSASVFSCSSFLSVRLREPACSCLSSRLFASVNAQGQTARKRVLQKKEQKTNATGKICTNQQHSRGVAQHADWIWSKVWPLERG